MKLALVPVQLGNGLVVMHTWEQWLALVKGVDLEAAHAAVAPIEPEPKEPHAE